MGRTHRTPGPDGFELNKRDTWTQDGVRAQLMKDLSILFVRAFYGWDQLTMNQRMLRLVDITELARVAIRAKPTPKPRAG